MIESAARLALVAERELEALVGVSSPSGDVPGAEECAALATAFLPPEARGRAPALLDARLRAGSVRAPARQRAAKRVLLLGHLDTVVAHSAHRPLERDGDRLTGSGTVDMKGGVALALGLMRELAPRPELYRELAVLLVNDEEWRTSGFGHIARFADFDACLCFEAGERTEDGDEAVIVKRKAAGTLRVEAHGRPAHSGSAPHRGRNALLALAAAAARVACRERSRRPRPADGGADHPALGGRLQRGARGRRAPLRPARRPARGARPGARRDAGGARRRAARELAGARLAGDGRARGDART